MGKHQRKAQARLKARILDYEKMCSQSKTNGKEYTKPGSSKK